MLFSKKPPVFMGETTESNSSGLAETNSFETITPQPTPSFQMPQPPAFNEASFMPKAPIMAPTPQMPEPIETPKEETVQVVQEEFIPKEVINENGQKIFKAKSIKDVNFSDIWLTPERVAYIRDKNTKFALIPFETEDLDEFLKILEQGFQGSASYAIRYMNEAYRVERVITTTGVQFNCRKMPTSTPSIYKLGLPDPIVKYLTTLATESGLILLAGPTGMGKTTTVSALVKEFLETHGGFLYTIEDPPEMPLDGLYKARNGGLGLCKQSPVENERWGDALKSALRSRPRYILVGEIRTPEVASQALRAATSGHLVLSTIHANSVEDALNSMIKYASGAGLDEKLVCDLLARGILGVVHQQLEGTTHLRPVIHTAFANPNPLVACQMRMSIREGKISLATFMEAQNTRIFQGRPIFREL